MTTKATFKLSKKGFANMQEYLDDSMKSVTSFDESVAVLNRSLAHLDEYDSE